MAEQGCRYFGGEMKNTYKIGDKVKIVNPEKDYPYKRFPIGTIGVITDIDMDDGQECSIGVTAIDENVSSEWWYCSEEIRPYPYTNAEKIRCMSDEKDEEFETFLEKYFCHEPEIHF